MSGPRVARRWVAVFTLFVLTAAAAFSQLLTGTYEVRFYDPRTKKVEPQSKDLPPGQVRRGIIEGKRFAVLDMMNGFQGPIRTKGKGFEFVFDDGPTGKVKKPEIATVVPSKDKKTLTIGMKGKTVMVWIWQTAKPAIHLPY